MNSPFAAATRTKEEQRLSRAFIISFPSQRSLCQLGVGNMDYERETEFDPTDEHLCGATYQIMANAVSRECAFVVQQNQFVFCKTYGIDDVNRFAVTLGFAGKSHLFPYQLRDRVSQVVRCEHGVPPIRAISSSRFAHSRLEARIWGLQLHPVP